MRAVWNGLGRAELTRGTFAVLYRNMLVYRRYWLSNIITGFFEPFVYLLGLGFGLGLYIDAIEGLPYRAFVAPGIIASAAMFAASFEATYGTFVRLNYQKTFDAMIATPVSVDDVVAGELLYGAVKSAISGAIILVAVAVTGILPVTGWAWLLLPLAALLTGLAFGAMALLVSSLVTNIDHFNYYVTLVLTPMFVFAGVFFPVENLPAAAQHVAWLTPLMHAVRLSRGLALGDWTHIGVDALWLAVFTLLLLPFPFWQLRRRLVR